MESKKETAGADVVIYRESQGYGVWLPAMILCLLAILIAAIVVLLVAKQWWFVIIPVVTLAAVLFAYLNFRTLVFEITDSRVKVAFGIFAKEIPRSKILSCEPFELTFKNYYGYGIRLGVDGTKAYNTRNGTGVKMKVDGERLPVVVSVDNPAKVCLLLAVKGEALSL